MSVPTTPWRLTVDNLLATKKYSDALLANKADPVPFLNTDRTVRPIQRYEPDLSEKRVLLVGQIPNIQPGLHMGIRGNRNSYPGRCFKPMTDGEVVHDILSLGSVTNEHRVLPTLWRRQIHMFHLLEAMAEEEIDNTPIMEAPLHFNGILKEGPSVGSPRHTIEIVWEKLETVDNDGDPRIVRDRDPRKVSKGALYLPSVLNYATPPFCMLQKDHLIQHWIQDEHGHLIPPWEMSNELRPGSLVAVVAAICERNTLCNGPECEYFERHYELRGRWAQVLKRGHGSPTSQSPPFVPYNAVVSCDIALERQRKLTEFDGFTASRRR